MVQAGHDHGVLGRVGWHRHQTVTNPRDGRVPGVGRERGEDGILLHPVRQGRVVDRVAEVTDPVAAHPNQPAEPPSVAAALGDLLRDDREAFVLHTWPYKETSLLVDAFAREEGRVAIVARGARARRSRAPMQDLADKVAGWFVPLVVLVAAGSFSMWWFVGPEPRVAYALVAAISA